METNRTCCCCLLRPPHRNKKAPNGSFRREDFKIYSNMFADCFGIQIIWGRECGICKACERRLWMACEFKQQVQRSQETLRAQLVSEQHVQDEEPEIKLEVSEDEKLKNVLMLYDPIKTEGPDVMSDGDSFPKNEDAMTPDRRESPVPVRREENVEQTYAVTFEHSSDDGVPLLTRRKKLKAAQADKTHKQKKIQIMKENDNETKMILTQNTLNSESGLSEEKGQTYSATENISDDDVPLLTRRNKLKAAKSSQPHRQKKKKNLNTLNSESASEDEDVYEKRTYTCQICQKVTASKRSMASHMENHFKPKSELWNENMWECEFCGKTFRKKYKTAHILNVHSKKKIKCDICFKLYPILYLYSHKKTHTERERKYCCEICGKSFFNSGCLYKHYQVHSVEKPFTCDICNMQFISKTVLVGHMYAHMRVKPYACECGKKYSVKASYRKHKIVAHGQAKRDKPFLCEICNKRFSERHLLKHHKLTHTGEKPYGCDTCGKYFAKKEGLRTHILTHVKGNYSCQLCPKTYSTKEGLRQHKRVHTRNKDAQKQRNNKGNKR